MRELEVSYRNIEVAFTQMQHIIKRNYITLQRYFFLVKMLLTIAITGIFLHYFILCVVIFRLKELFHFFLFFKVCKIDIFWHVEKNAPVLIKCKKQFDD